LTVGVPLIHEGRANPWAQEVSEPQSHGYFQDLPREVKQAAQMWLWRFSKRWGRSSEWRFAILVGQAKRLALNPPTSDWGRTMLAKR